METEAPSGALPIDRESAESGMISVIVPVTERPELLAELFEEYAAPLRALGRPFEFIFALDAHWRSQAPPLLELTRQGAPVRVLEVAHTVGEAALLKMAAGHAHGDVLLTLPPYRRVVPESIPGLIRQLERGADLAVARRWPRRDSLINRIQNRLFHLLIRPLFGAGIHDVACGVRAMRREVIEETVVYGDMVRFLPLLGMRQGFRVVELPAPQHIGDVRARVYSPGLYLRRMLDVLGLFFLVRFSEKPLRFFGLFGSGSLTVGGILLFILFLQKLGGQSIANRPLLLLAGLLVVVGIEAIALGLIGEIIVYLHARHVGRRPTYKVQEHSRG